MKKTSAKFAASIFVLLAIIVSATIGFAASSGEFNYNVLTDGTVSITKFTGSSSVVVIPDTIDGKVVSTIGERAFRYAKITSITIPGSVKKVDLKAFLGCESLTAVVFQSGDNEIEIGDYAFDGCTELVAVEIGAKGINLHERAFRYCSSLQAVTFTNSPTSLSVGEKAFLGCTGLLLFDVPDTVPSLEIGAYAFDGATALQKVHLSGEKIKLDERAFRYCESIKEVSFSDGTKSLAIGDKAFLGCNKMVNFIIPDTTTELTIGEYAFDGGSSLSAVTLGTGNVRIGERAFRYCDSLTKLLIPSGNVSIGEKAFLGCNKLTLYGDVGSTAEQYARSNRINFADSNSYSPVALASVEVAIPDNNTNSTAGEAPNTPSVIISQEWTCPNCGNTATGNFCNNCGTARPTEAETTATPTAVPTTAPTAAPINTSDSKHLQYIRNYVGLNALSVGYTSLGGDRMDQYGACYIEISFITEDGTFIDIENDAQLQQYVVIGQNPAPNSEIHITYQKDSTGKEYSNLTETQSFESIDLYVKRVGSSTEMTDFGEVIPLLSSPDKYTRFVRNYVGKNLASVGYTSLGGDRMDAYGAGYVELVFITPDGTFIDINESAQMQEYVVVAQNYAPNTEMHFIFQKDSNGKEYSNLIDSQTIEQIDLYVVKRSELPYAAPAMTAIKAASDRRTYYIRDYVGKNVANVGYTSLGGTRNDKYGAAYIQFVFVTDDGAYIDPSDEEQMKQYVVTGQDVAPNSEMKLIYMTNSKGEEYSNLIESQTYNKITLYVKRIETAAPTSADQISRANNATDESLPVVTATPAPSANEETVSVTLASGRTVSIRKSVKEALDVYESFMDGYKDAMTKISDGDFTGYLAFMEKYEELMNKVGDMEDDLTEDESWYYYEVSMRVLEKMY